ncbi:prolyl oligopeptidase family serine peptidase [Actinoallomurus bryophytorum]|uniref:Dipeptidyl-peptidase-4 n=1 Tax=Actinoallomurus bryophytorum TaxID=1490222 RepID=A0A543BZT3_9ACTN|nr:prolyl oligopeptidase family serine peptidase [Actinoallomurus bryophytorum]TQL90327.1 dipeptidyl-peptidase-4 [Actinoallomurus bryophytorum]
MATDSLHGRLFPTRRFSLGVPGHFTVTPDGASVLFLRSRAGDDPVTCLWALDTDSGTERLLADPAELLGASAPAGAGVDAYATDPAAGLAAVTLAGGLWTVDLAGGRVRCLPAEGPVADPRPAPGARRIAYVCGGALRVIETDGTGDRAIAAPDGPEVTFGTAEHTHATSPDGPRGHWWAPDGARLLVARVDPARVGRWHAADAAEPGTAPRTVRYATAGTANAEVTLWITGIDGSRTEAVWDRDAFEYLVGAGWDAHGPYAVVQSRDQRTVRFLVIDPAGGGTRVLSEQRDACWVQLLPGLPARTASGALVAHADLRGTRHLTVDGLTVTPPGLQVRAVLGVDGDEVVFTASDEPAETHVWSHRAGGGVRRLSAEAGVHSAVRRGGTLVRVARCADRPGGRVSVSRDGRPAVPIASLVERPPLDVRVTRLVLGPRELRGALYLPSWHRTGVRLPVLVDPYGGAGRQQVTAELTWRCLVSQWFAEQGFAVLVADGAGTPGRGPDWEREVHGDLFGPVLEDQVTALREAARLHPDLDLGRVGIRGWSFGGSLAALAVLRRPDVFHAAVAGAGVTDQLLYNTHWRERFLGHPREFPGRYEASSLVAAAPDLTRPLLLIHGLADTNVHPANTLRLSTALLAAGRPHEVLLLPGVGHHAMATAATENLLHHQAHFLRRHLCPSGDATRSADGIA